MIKLPCLLLVDDHAMFRAGLSLVIQSAIPDAVVVEAGSIDQAIRTDALHVDVILLDIKLKGLSGLEGLQVLRQHWPAAQVLFLSSQDDAATVRKVTQQGVAGFVSKAESAETIVAAIFLAWGAVNAPMVPLKRGVSEKRLTLRQCEVVDLLGQGMSNKLIARHLALSENTVRRHVQDVLSFFEVASRMEAVFMARGRGLIS